MPATRGLETICDDLAKTLAEEERIEALLTACKARSGELIRELRALPDAPTWQQLTELTGLSYDAMQWRGYHDHYPSRQKPAPARRVLKEPAPGLAVAEAARILGISRPTVYAWLKAGRLGQVEHEGKMRIAATADGQPASPDGAQVKP